METYAYMDVTYTHNTYWIMKIEYWMRETNATINQLREHTLLLMENKIDIRFIMKRQLVR